MTGVNTWAYTLAKELNHEIDIEIQDFGQRLFDYQKKDTTFVNLIGPSVSSIYLRNSAPYEKYDIIILNYNTHEYLIEFSPAKKIYVIHGTSWPSGMYYEPRGQHTTVAVCDRIKEKLNTDYVIYNGIDLTTFIPKTKSKSKPSKVFRLSRYPIKPKLLEALSELDISVIGDAIVNKPQSRIIELIHKSDFVISYGRGVYEAMACGKPVFVSGTNGTDGWITEGNFLDIRHSNAAGYYLDDKGENFLPIEKLIDNLKFYNKNMGEVNRMLAEKYLSSVTMAQEYDNVMRRLHEGTDKDISP